MFLRKVVVLASMVVLIVHQAAELSFAHAGSPANTSAVPGRPSAGLAAALDEYLRRAEAFGFSGAVLVAKDGEVLLHKGYGLADRGRQIPVTTRTVFYVASISKSFTAAAILKLEMQGKLSTSDPITKFFDGVPADKAAITLHHLLTHTSGIGRVPDNDHAAASRDGFVSLLLATPGRAKAGEKYDYSNEGYSLLAAVVDKVSGLPFAEYVEQYLLRPAGMSGSGIVTGRSKWAAGDISHSYYGGLEEGDALLSHHKPYAWTDIGGTGMVSSPGDLYKWEVALRGNTILSDAAKKKYYTPFLEDYAYGWGVSATSRKTTIIRHTGQKIPEGWNADFRRYVDEGITIIVASNADRDEPLGWTASANLARIIFGGAVNMPPLPADARASELKSYAGVYALPSGADFTISPTGKHLSIEARGQQAINLLVYQDRKKADLHADDNEIARSFYEALSKGDFESLKAIVGSNRPFDAWKTQLGERWRWLEGRFGKFERFEIIHSLGSDDPDELTRIYVKLHFQKQSTVVRTLWEKKKFVGMSDAGAFMARAQEVPVFPTVLPVVRQAKDTFVVFDLDTSKSLYISFHRAANGTVDGLNLHTKNGDATATRKAM